MRMVDIIDKKKDGFQLTKSEIDFVVEGYTMGKLPDYQLSALLMAIYFQGMDAVEASNLTEAMIKSGDQIDLSQIKGVKVDKHSTGGVGDTTTLILAPLVASVGVPIAKMSGRGLGHTGGTIDKLEAIPGFQIELSPDDFIKAVNTHKVALVGQSGNLTPADKKFYALRDVTATVDSIPLIASSIMSKKIAAGADAIVLDVKVGSGAFMKDDQEAGRLAKTMVEIGNQVGRKTMAIVSDMSQPLGRAVGNALELKEAFETLKGQGPADLTELVLTLGSQMVVLGQGADNLEDARKLLVESIESGEAIQVLKELITNQGGDARVVDEVNRLPKAKFQVELPAKKTGVVQSIEAEKVGVASMRLGAGRASKEDDIDLAVGLVLHKKIGDQVEQGESLLTIHTNHEDVDSVKKLLYENIIIGDHATPPQLIHQIVSE